MVILNDSRFPSLISYKYHILPNAKKSYGDVNSKQTHEQNIQNILKILALNGPATTWEMAKIKSVTDTTEVHSQEKKYRRLLVGRKDRGRYSKGILDLNLVLIDSISTKRNPGRIYRLSIYGILYCLGMMSFTNKEIDKIVKNYQDIIPKIFGKWEFLKSNIGENVYNVSLLGKGLLFDNANIIKMENSEFYELISYFNIKSNILSESLTEKKIGELISLWFYISLLFFPNLIEKTKTNYLRQVFKKDDELKRWFSDFILEAEIFYKDRITVLKNMRVI